MGLYNFRKRFAPHILDGTKRHTIRGSRKHPDKPGSTMYLYTGLRTKYVTHLFNAPCLSVEPIVVTDKGIDLSGRWLDGDQADQLAWADGFRELGSSAAFPGLSWDLMRLFWLKTHELPWEGWLNTWDYDRRWIETPV